MDDALDLEGRERLDRRLDRDGFELPVRFDLKRPAHDEEEVRDALVAIEDDVEQLVELGFQHDGDVSKAKSVPS